VPPYGQCFCEVQADAESRDAPNIGSWLNYSGVAGRKPGVRHVERRALLPSAPHADLAAMSR
jgi:hypothetical protein